METSGDFCCFGNTENKKVRINQLSKYVFTFNNYSESDLETLLDVFKNICTKYVFQKEVGESGTPHLQGAIWLKKAMRFTEFKLSDKIHWEKMNNEKASMAYCQKSDTATGDVYVWGMKLLRPLKIIKESELYSWQSELYSKVKNVIPNDRTIMWIWEEMGNVGKSAFCKFLVKTEGALFIDEGKKSDLVNLVFNADMDQCDIIVLDIPRANGNSCSYKTLEAFKNGMVCNTKYETGVKLFNPPHIIVFSNYYPEVEELSLDRWEIFKIKDLQLERMIT